MAAFKMDSYHEWRYWEIWVRYNATTNKKIKKYDLTKKL
jgi:hypothetical protein